MPSGKTRKQLYLSAIANNDIGNLKPLTRKELFYAKMAGDDVNVPDPATKAEQGFKEIIDKRSGSTGGGGSVQNCICEITIVNNSQHTFEVSGELLIVGDGYLKIADLGRDIAIDPEDNVTYDILMDYVFIEGEDEWTCVTNIFEANMLSGVKIVTSDLVNCQFQKIDEPDIAGLAVRTIDATKPCSLTVTLQNIDD